LPSNTDKIGHTLAHIIFVVLWFLVFNYKFKFKFNKAVLCAALFSLAYGIIIELLQGLITLSRQSDVNDVIANAVGMVIAVLLLLSVKKRVLKYNNTLLF
jgi:glycopeptide antibiotics resistance protein